MNDQILINISSTAKLTHIPTTTRRYNVRIRKKI